jgi:hypothetical protein
VFDVRIGDLIFPAENEEAAETFADKMATVIAEHTLSEACVERALTEYQDPIQVEESPELKRIRSVIETIEKAADVG